MKIAITVICCLIPCIGMVLGLLMLFKGTKRKTDAKPGTLPGSFLVSSGRLILLLALAELVLTLLILFFAPVTGTKPVYGMSSYW